MPKGSVNVKGVVNVRGPDGKVSQLWTKQYGRIITDVRKDGVKYNELEYTRYG